VQQGKNGCGLVSAHTKAQRCAPRQDPVRRPAAHQERMRRSSARADEGAAP
jgi:hypothetical protein